MSRNLVVVVLMILCASVAVRADEAKPKADEAESVITRGLDAYRSGKAEEAISHLQKAIALIQKSLQKSLAAHFPKVPQGWQAGKIESQSLSIGSTQGSGAWRQVSRTYTRKQDKLKVTVAMTNSRQLIQAQAGAAAAYRNPQMLRMLNQDPKTRIELIDEKGWFGWTVVNKGRDARATAFREGCLLTVSVSKDDENALKTFWQRIDLKALAGTKPPRHEARREVTSGGPVGLARRAPCAGRAPGKVLHCRGFFFFPLRTSCYHLHFVERVHRFAGVWWSLSADAVAPARETRKELGADASASAAAAQIRLAVQQ